MPNRLKPLFRPTAQGPAARRRACGALLVGAAALGLLPTGGLAEDTRYRTVASLDLPRYMGTWYELAKYPNRFQRDCARDTQASYRLLPQGTVEVRNQCIRADGAPLVAIGEARRVDASPEGARLEVRFAPAWLSFLPMVWGDYWVLDLDPDMTLAAVGEPSGTYLWILSRTPHVPAGPYQALLDRLAHRGLDVQRLEATPQSDP